MDAKEIKSALKAAREAIRQKEFKEALRQCKAILAEDKTNYNALVFIGVAAEGLEQYDQALKAYTRATQESPDQTLAWQGLSTMLEKQSHLFGPEEAERVLDKMVSLNSSDSSKQLPYLKKLIQLYVGENKTEQILLRVSQVLSLGPDAETNIEMSKLAIDTLAPLAPEMEDGQRKLYETALRTVLESDTSDNPDDLDPYLYQWLLYTAQVDPTQVLGRSNELGLKFPESAHPLEFLLSFHLDQSIGCEAVSPETVSVVEDLMDRLKATKPRSEVANVAEGFLFLMNKDLLKARDILQDVTTSISAVYFLSQTWAGLHVFDKSVAACLKGISLCADPKIAVCASRAHVTSVFKLCQASALQCIGTMDARTTALTLLDQVSDAFPAKTVSLRALVKLGEGDLEAAKSCVDALPPDGKQFKVLRASICMEAQDFKGAICLLTEVTAANPSDAKLTLMLGKALWENRKACSDEGTIQHCFTTLLKAAKLDPFNFESYLILGYIYKDIHEDLGKARRCFQKSHDLSQGRELPSCALVDVLNQLGEESRAVDILEEITSHAAPGQAKWAWLRLGLHQSKHDDPTTAIASLQSALRADPNDSHVWECLADAYFQRGSYTAALKAFTKATELDPDSLYSHYQIAKLKHILGSLPEAIHDYKKILAKSENYVPVLKGIADSLIQLGKHHISQCMDGLARDCCQEAITYLARAASQRPELSCLWKSLGDACLMTHCLAAGTFCIPSQLVDSTSGRNDSTTVNKQKLMEVATRCLSQAVKLQPSSGALWHDLGVSMYYRGQHLMTSDPESSKDLVRRAGQAVRKALTLEPSDWTHWNLMGVIALTKVDERSALAQHCFIKSLECESNNAVAWSNLGTLYLTRSEIKLAHEAFKAAQSADPTYTACWIGQAMIADIVGHEEAMDLFRHTTELGVHLESALGYGRWVLSTLGDPGKQNSELFHYCIQQMAAIPAASDSLVRYTRRVGNDPVAFNMLGLVLEHQKLLGSAVEAFERARVLIQETGDQSKLNDVQLNLARVLSKQGFHQKAANLYDLCDPGVNLSSLCMYGHCLYKAGRLMDAFKVYEGSLEHCTTDRERSEVYAALGMLAYKFDDLDGAKSQLFNGFQTSDPSPVGLYALCALGLLQGDVTLATATLQEMNKLDKGGHEHGRVVGLLHLYKSVLEKDLCGGEACLREAISSDQDVVGLRTLLQKFVLEVVTNQDGGKLLLALAKDPVLHTHKNDAESWLLAAMSQLTIGQHSRVDSTKNAIKAAQKAFVSNPGCVSSLCVLACAVHAEAVIDTAFKGRSALLPLEAGVLHIVLDRDPSPEVRQWCFKSLAINKLLDGDLEASQKYCDQLSQIPECQNFVNLMRACLACDVSGVGSSHHLALVVCSAILVQRGDVKQAIDLLRSEVESQENISDLMHRNLLERIGLLSSLETGDDGEGLSYAHAALADRTSGSCVMSLLQASRTQDNIRLCKHRFATALDNADTPAELGHGAALARQGIISLLWGSKKEADQKLVQALLDDAKLKKDETTENLVATLRSSK